MPNEPVSTQAMHRQTRSSLVQEVRFAVVMYGGVSLAIYINGVAQELLRLVRSTANGGNSVPSDAYKKLNYFLADKKKDLRKAEEALKNNMALQTRFVVDIISGTSAGGINGIYLAKALSSGMDMEELRHLWIKEGDIALLINDKKSVESPLEAQKPPQSLLNSNRMYVKLLKALASMDGVDLAKPPAETNKREEHEECKSPFVDELDLFITATDIQGIPLPIRLADDVVFERRYRNAFHFIYSADNDRNDFLEKYNPFLAYAARCTSSFPFAFEPMRLTDIDPILDGFPYYRGNRQVRSESARWKRFYKEYKHAAGNKPTEFRKRSFGDGGYLDNRPFSYAIEMLLRRNADVPVDRKLIYVEPSPEHPEEEKESAEKPDFLQNSIAAMLTLPRYETIREDLQRVMDRNRIAQRLNKVVRGVEQDVEQANIVNSDSLTDIQWAELDLADMVVRKGRGYAGYQRLDIAAVTDALAQVVARLSHYDEESDYLTAIRALIKAWRMENYVDYKSQAPDKPTSNQFLWSFNWDYPLRRLNFLRAKIDQMYALDESAKKSIELNSPAFWSNEKTLSESDKSDFQKELLRIKTVFNDVNADLIKEARLLRSSSNLQNPLQQGISFLNLGMDKLDFILGRKELGADMRTLLRKRQAESPDESLVEDECIERARILLREYPAIHDALGHPKKLDVRANAAVDNSFSGMLSSRIEKIKLAGDKTCLNAVAEEAGVSIGVATARKCLGRYYQFFDDYDMTIFPIQYGADIRETDAVEIIRISPEDAKALINERETGCLKLAGTALSHFGAFLETLWRQSDILWGRLDGAERIISALLPNHPEQASVFIAEAHSEIIAELIDEMSPEALKDVLIESMMRTNDGAPDEDGFAKFVSKLTSNPLIKTKLDNKIDEASLRDYYRKKFPENSKCRPEPALRNAARAATVVGGMLEGLAEKYDRGGKIAAWVTRIGRIFWGLVEVAVPRSIPNIIAHHWLKLLYLFDALVIVLGVILTSQNIRSTGWKALGITLAVNLLVLLMSDIICGKLSKWRKTKMLLYAAAGALLILGIYEARAHLVDDLSIWWKLIRGSFGF